MDIKLLNTVSLEKIGDENFQCGCGSDHRLRTSFLYGEHAVKSTCDALAKLVAKNVRVLMITGEESYIVAGKPVEEQLKKDYLVTKCCLKNCVPSVKTAEELLASIEDDTRAVIAVGGATIADIGKLVAERSGRACVYVPSTPAALFSIVPYSALFNRSMREFYAVKPPALVIGDTDILSAAPREHLAAAFGQLLAQIMAGFDRYFGERVMGEKHCENLQERLNATIDAVLQTAEGVIKGDKQSIATMSENIFRAAALMQMLYSERVFTSGELLFSLTEELYFIMGRRPRRLWGENAIINANYLRRIYRLLLTEAYPDYIPFDDTLRADRAKDLLGVDQYCAFANMPRIIDPYDFEIYRHKKAEYRDELLARLTACDNKLDRAYKYYRRIYDDAGLWTKKYLTEQDLSTVLALAPDARPRFSILAFMKFSGLLDAYLA